MFTLSKEQQEIVSKESGNVLERINIEYKRLVGYGQSIVDFLYQNETTKNVATRYLKNIKQRDQVRFLVGAFISTFLICFWMQPLLISDLICTLYPIYMTITTLSVQEEKEAKLKKESSKRRKSLAMSSTDSESEMWLKYWCIYSIIKCIIEPMRLFASEYLPLFGFFLFKALFCLWLYLPETVGVDTIYDGYLRSPFKNIDQQMNNSSEIKRIRKSIDKIEIQAEKLWDIVDKKLEKSVDEFTKPTSSITTEI